MAKSPTLALKAEDYAKILADYPEMDALLRNLTRLGTGTNGALNRGLTVSENFAAQVADIDVAPSSDWQTATYAGAWGTFAGPPAGMTAQYVKLENGLVRLRGLVVGGATGTTVFTLPTDYAPDRQITLPAETSALLSATVTIGTTGTVVVAFAGAPAWISLDAGTFVAADRHPEINDSTGQKVKLSLPAGRKVQGVQVLKARDVTNRSNPTHVGNPPWVDWHEDGGQLIIEHISGLSPARKYQVRLLIWGQ